MQVAERVAGGTLAGEDVYLHGWGGVAPSRARVLQVRTAPEILDALRAAQGSGGAIARGAGCSYGDAAQNGGGCVIDAAQMRRILHVDRERGLVTAEAGATFGQLLAALARRGLTLPVVPGTRHVTLGGAIASDVHGKNHHHDGALARHVRSIELCAPAIGRVDLTPESDRELFYATLGGMGLTGVITRATLAAEPLASGWVAADTERTRGLEQTLMGTSEQSARRYAVAWLDLLAAGARFGRGVVSGADPLPAASEPSRGGAAMGHEALAGEFVRGPQLEVPRWLPASPLRPAAVRAYNALRWRAARRGRGRALALGRYLFPLDGLGHWPRLYGRGGLIQYQFVVPDRAEDALVRCVELMRMRKLPVYLAVLKRLGAAFGGPLSFPLQGWTLAVDLPAATPGLAHALDALDETVAGAGGRVYLTKDVRLGAQTLRSMYPELDRLQEVRGRVDPDGVLRSDLSRRLGLSAGP